MKYRVRKSLHHTLERLGTLNACIEHSALFTLAGHKCLPPFPEGKLGLTD